MMSNSIFQHFKIVTNLILIIILISFSNGCMSEEERKTAERLKKLDELTEQIQPQLLTFFDGMSALDSIVNPQEPLTDSTKITGRELEIFNLISTHYDSIVCVSEAINNLNPPIKFNENAILMFLSPEALDDSKENLVNFVWYYDKMLVWRILEKLTTNTWNDGIAKPSSWESEESRDNNAAETEQLMRRLAKCKYILGIEMRLIKQAKVLDDKNYNSGYAFSKVHVYNVNTKKINTVFYMFNENSFLTFVNNSTKESVQAGLDKDLEQETFLQLKRRFE